MESEFEKELEDLINKHSMENGSNTPDFILAQYLKGCLDNFNIIIQARESWYGRGVIETDIPYDYDGTGVPPPQNPITTSSETNNWLINPTKNTASEQNNYLLSHEIGEKINEIYNNLNKRLLDNDSINTVTTRSVVKHNLKQELVGKEFTYPIKIKCDEENNSPEVLEGNILIAKLMWKDDTKTSHYHNLIFGKEEDVKKYVDCESRKKNKSKSKPVDFENPPWSDSLSPCENRRCIDNICPSHKLYFLIKIMKELLLEGCTIKMPYKEKIKEWMGEVSILIIAGGYNILPKIIINGNIIKEFGLKDIDAAIHYFKKTVFNTKNLMYKQNEARIKLSQVKPDFDLDDKNNYDEMERIREDLIKEANEIIFI